MPRTIVLASTKKNYQAKKTTQQDFNNETPFSPHLSQIRIRGRTPGGLTTGSEWGLEGLRSCPPSLPATYLRTLTLTFQTMHRPVAGLRACTGQRAGGGCEGGADPTTLEETQFWPTQNLTQKYIMSAVYHLPNDLGVRLSLWKLTHLIRLSKISKFCNLAFFKYPPPPPNQLVG